MKTLAACCFLAISRLAAGDKSSGERCADAARHFVASLDSSQQAKISHPFLSDSREDFHYTPRERTGLPLKELTFTQRNAAMALLDSFLSEAGKLKATQVITLESVLADLEKNPIYRDDGKYYINIFGEIGDDRAWGIRFEGHHLSLNLTIVGGQACSVTPTFLGANPGEVGEGEHKGLRVLAAEEDHARALVTTLLTAGKSNVIFSATPPGEILTGENRTVTVLDPVGIEAAEMSEAQRAALQKLIADYTGLYRPDIAATDIAKMEAAGLDKIRFGWAGGTKPGEPFYYRIQGPTFLMEVANTQNQANHVHCAWRDFTGDFGRDLLREHYDAKH